VRRGQDSRRYFGLELGPESNRTRRRDAR